ncbi:MAG: GMC family oxidoreductase N-terminal domain-containing protein [Anaerolineae bacterium]|nr:GMC family oxidoreductase N-terminal domain-containing protein [Anaerolineae bacterium]
MPFLTPDQKHTLTLICETFVPALPPSDGDNAALFGLGAADVNLVDMVEENILAVTDSAARFQLQLILNLIESRLFNRLTVGISKPFSAMLPDERTALLRAWGNSQYAPARQWFQSLKRLALFLFYAAMPDNQPHPAWASFAYPAHPPRTEPATPPIKPLAITAPTTLYADVLVIGSGAGGGVVAGELSAAGQDVIVVEKGAYYADHQFSGRELGSQSLFEKRGLLTTADLSMSILAGTTLGGGTTINWAASLRTPEDVLYEWEHEYGFTGASGEAFQHSLDAVLKRLNVEAESSPVNATNSALDRGCKALGYEVSPIPRNVKGCEECGFCNFGCPFGAKQGTLKTYLQEAHERGTRILVNAHVNHLLIERGAAVGAALTVQSADGLPQPVTIRAKRVVVAAGAIHTPALLLRSGLTNANIGANLHLHPVTVTYGLFDEPVLGWQGPPMTRLSRQFANLDGHGYGVRLETAPVHPGLAAATFPWQSGATHKRMMSSLPNLANIITITRDRHSGQVKVNAAGEPVIHYKLHPFDAAHMLKGMTESLRVHIAAGATEVSSPHNQQMRFRPADGGSLDTFLGEVAARGLHPNAYALFSAHQMSSCRIGGDSATGALDPTGASYEVRNLYVADGSALPTASGVNPMISIMATAHFLAQGMKAGL